MPRNYTEDELKNGRWVTMKGTRVFIKDGETPQEAIDRAMGKQKEVETDNKRKEYLDKIRQKLLDIGVDEEHTEQIISAINKIHKQFPEITEVYSINAAYLESTQVACMNGVGLLTIDKSKLIGLQNGRYDYLFGYHLAGNNFENGLIGHELAHNLDMQFSTFMMAKAPDSAEKEVMTARNEKWANLLSEVTGKKVNVGDEITFPAWDTKTEFLTIGDKTYSIKTMPHYLSDVVVPTAISNIQKNYTKYGFETEPTRAMLAKTLSGYAYRMEETSDFYAEVFAESYAGSISGRPNVLGDEVMRITNQVYKDLDRRKNNEYEDFMARFYEAVARAREGW